jgi:hypothetical protein
MLTGSLLSGAGSILGGIFGGGAAKQQAQALAQAQQFLKGEEAKGTANFDPFLHAGTNSTYTLGSLLGTPGKGLLAPWTGKFTAPTAAQAEATPGYQFQLKAGEDAMTNSAAGRGSLLTGRTLADLNTFAQGTASENYQNVFNNALTQYNSSYNSFLNNQNNTYQRLMGLSGEGLQAAGGDANLISGIGGDVASLMGAQGAAQAGGTLAMGQGIGGFLSDLGGGFTMRGLNGSQGGSSPNFNPSTSGIYNPTTGTYNP